eukprot:scaffold5610_cov237-Skeletonema_marinoi.AAC.4
MNVHPLKKGARKIQKSNAKRFLRSGQPLPRHSRPAGRILPTAFITVSFTINNEQSWDAEEVNQPPPR